MEGIRQARKAGSWYNSDPTQLNSELETNLSNARKTKPVAKSIIGPHAGYRFSGSCSAWAYTHCDVQSVKTIFLLGPSHRASIDGCALPASTIYETPLGNIPVHTKIIEQLKATGLFKQLTKSVEEDEHSLELHLPYIRKTFENHDIKLVPLMVGQINPQMETRYGEIFAPYYRDPQTMFIISTDFWHWGHNFNYRPYDESKGKRHEYIEWLDQQAVTLIQEHNNEAFRSYLSDTRNTICGRNPILVLLGTIRASGLAVRTEMVQYDQSNRVERHTDSQVSYVSMPWIGLLITAVWSFMDQGVSQIPAFRVVMMLPSLLFSDFVSQIIICYTGLLFSSIFQLTIIDISLLLFWTGILRYQSKNMHIQIAVIVAFLIWVQSVYDDKNSECLVFLMGCIGIIKLIEFYEKYEVFEKTETNLKNQIQELKDTLEKRHVEKDFEYYSRQPITSAKAQNLIDKLQKLGPLTTELKRNPSNSSLQSLYGAFRHQNRIHTSSRNSINLDSLDNNSPITPKNNLEALNLETSGSVWKTLRKEGSEDLPDLSLSMIFNSTNAQHGSFVVENHQLTSDDIDDLINTIINREYLLSEPKAVQPEDLDIFQVGKDVKSKYTQAIQHRNANTSYLEDRYAPKETNLLRTMTEENNDLEDFLEVIGEWNFDTLTLNIASDKHPLKELGQYVFTTLGLPYHFNISNEHLKNFLEAAENKYNREVYYHNCIHAADVLNSIVFLLQNGLHRRGRMMDLDVFAVVVSAITHDIGHPGVNNAFLVSSSDPLSIKYNDQSVLENMHCGITFEILENEDMNIIGSLDIDQMRQFRQTAIAIILATDLQKHFDKLAEFRKILNSDEGFVISNDKHKLIALEICLKCADIGHSAKKLGIHKVWTMQITKEFFKQGDREMELGMPVSPLCDRDTSIADSQRGFLNVLALPLFEVWEEFIEQEDTENSDSAPHRIMTSQIHMNIDFWEREMVEQTFWLDNEPPKSMIQRKRRIRTAGASG